MSVDVFSEVADLLFGSGGDQLITKMNPAQSDLSTADKDKRKRKITAGLSAVGAAAGGAGLALGGHNIHGTYKLARYGASGGKAARAAKHAAAATKPIATRRAALKTAFGREKLATGLIPLEVAGLTGEVAATRILHGDTKKKQGQLVKKDLGDMLNNASETSSKMTQAKIPSPKRSAQKKGIEYAQKRGGKLLPIGAKGHAKVEKIWAGEISKINEEKQQIFGWASVVEVNGEPVVDLQGDYISTDEMEKAGYEYVMKSRKGGDMHLRDDWSPIQKSEMIESFIVTPEKRSALGLPESVPSGWWVGFQVRDPDVWAKVKSGERTGFSIHGHGKRVPA